MRPLLVVLAILAIAASSDPSVEESASIREPLRAASAADGSSRDSPAKGSFRKVGAQQRRLPLGLALRAARPWSFTATLSPVLLGTALAFKVEDKFRLLRLVLSLLVTLSVHAAGNLMNTYFDFKNGVDTASSSDTILVNGQLEPSQVARLIGWSYAIAACAAAPLPLVSRAPLPLLLLHLVAGAASAFVYTGGPGLKYKALGDVLISSTFGPLLVSFAFLVQAGSTGWGALLASLPITSHIEAILHANNARDVKEDLANGVRTVAAALPEPASFALYAGLLFAPFAAVLVQVRARPEPSRGEGFGSLPGAPLGSGGALPAQTSARDLSRAHCDRCVDPLAPAAPPLPRGDFHSQALSLHMCGCVSSQAWRVSSFAALPMLSFPLAARLVQARLCAAHVSKSPAPSPPPPPCVRARVTERPHLCVTQAFRQKQMFDLPKKTAKFQFAFGMLLVVGILVPSPPLGALLGRLL